MNLTTAYRSMFERQRGRTTVTMQFLTKRKTKTNETGIFRINDFNEIVKRLQKLFFPRHRLSNRIRMNPYIKDIFSITSMDRCAIVRFRRWPFVMCTVDNERLFARRYIEHGAGARA